MGKGIWSRIITEQECLHSSLQVRQQNLLKAEDKSLYKDISPNDGKVFHQLAYSRKESCCYRTDRVTNNITTNSGFSMVVKINAEHGHKLYPNTLSVVGNTLVQRVFFHSRSQTS